MGTFCQAGGPRQPTGPVPSKLAVSDSSVMIQEITSYVYNVYIKGSNWPRKIRDSFKPIPHRIGNQIILFYSKARGSIIGSKFSNACLVSSWQLESFVDKAFFFWSCSPVNCA